MHKPGRNFSLTGEPLLPAPPTAPSPARPPRRGPGPARAEPVCAGGLGPQGQPPARLVGGRLPN